MPRQQCIALRPFIGFQMLEKGRRFSIKPLWGLWPACRFLCAFALFELHDMIAGII